MYEKLSAKVERVIQAARALARASDQEYLGTEHVLLAIQQEAAGLGSQVLQRLGADEYRLRAEIERLVKKNMEETWVFGKLPGSPHLKAAVGRAVQLARQMQAPEVCTEHLLLAMLSEKGSVAERALTNLGVTTEKARESLAQISAQA